MITPITLMQMNKCSHNDRSQNIHEEYNLEKVNEVMNESGEDNYLSPRLKTPIKIIEEEWIKETVNRKPVKKTLSMGESGGRKNLKAKRIIAKSTGENDLRTKSTNFELRNIWIGGKKGRKSFAVILYIYIYIDPKKEYKKITKIL